MSLITTVYYFVNMRGLSDVNRLGKIKTSFKCGLKWLFMNHEKYDSIYKINNDTITFTTYVGFANFWNDATNGRHAYDDDKYCLMIFVMRCESCNIDVTNSKFGLEIKSQYFNMNKLQLLDEIEMVNYDITDRVSRNSAKLKIDELHDLLVSDTIDSSKKNNVERRAEINATLTPIDETVDETIDKTNDKVVISSADIVSRENVEVFNIMSFSGRDNDVFGFINNGLNGLDDITQFNFDLNV